MRENPGSHGDFQSGGTKTPGKRPPVNPGLFFARFFNPPKKDQAVSMSTP
jgi:hypothetical protein